ncbi:MAG: bifunctional DNA primase/polymerase [Phototrophicaceae bacterium]
MSDLIKQAIEQAKNQNWSIIPLKGYGEDAKRPAPSLGSWSQYQQTFATSVEIEQWLANGMTAYGVIMGKSSGNTFVIDFDNLGIYHNFCREFPKIAQSYTVQTRKGYHLYLKSVMPIPTTRFSGGDIIGEGSYVVGAGSTIKVPARNNQRETHYTIENNTTIQNITQKQWQAIKRTLKIQRPQDTKPNERTQITIEALQKQYNQRALQNGRNNTLYSLARQAYNNNINIEDTIQTLVKQHISAQAPKNHLPETQQQREKEALRTIQSAYRTRGANALKLKTTERHKKGQLPNNLREALLRATARQNKAGVYVGASATTARLIEALYRQNYLGTITDEKNIRQVAKRYKISLNSVSSVLKGTSSNQRIISVVSYSDIDNPPVGEGERKVTSQVFYRIPSLEELLNHFDLVPQAVDVLCAEDLYSNKKYLQAMHREFIKRNGANTSTIFCANRLSITPRTLQTYDNDLNIIKTAVVQYITLGWHNVDEDIFATVDNQGITPGIWIQDSEGKRYPAIKGIALKLLKDSTQLILCKQKTSRRYLPNPVIIFHEVWWVASDGSQWGGAAHDFPPQAITDYPSEDTLEIEAVSAISPEALTEQLSGRHVDPSTTYYRLKFEAQERKRLELMGEQVQQTRQTQTFVVDSRINASLQLIKGIGERIREQLAVAGIDFMTDLISMGAESVAKIFHYNSYISPRTTQAWIDQAELLLGLRPSTANELNQKRIQLRQRALKQYKKAYKTLQGFINDLLINDEQHNILLWRFKQRLDIWLEHPYLFTTFKFNAVKNRVIDELEAYLKYLHIFFSMDECWLTRWHMESTQYWQKRAQQVKKQLVAWHDLSLD